MWLVLCLLIAASCTESRNETPKYSSHGPKSPAPAGCPPEGPWADRDCPEASWARSVVEEAGYKNDGNTGSALKVLGNGQFLNLWTTPIKEKNDGVSKELNEGTWQARGRVRGIQVLRKPRRVGLGRASTSRLGNERR
jgi:hypothetical protein